MSKDLKHILRDIDHKLNGPENLTINKIEFDSRKVGKGDLFVAVKGIHVDGHDFIEKAIEQGAVAIVCEQTPSLSAGAEVCLIEVKNSARALGEIAANYYDNPSRTLKLTGVTGTNGKTSIVTLLHRLLTEMGIPCGLLSTVVNKIGEEDVPATHTTPDALTIQRLLRDMADAGCSHAFMEVSSHAIDQNRIAGLEFDIAVFTNITHDHLDYHETFDEYIKVKKRFFDELQASAFALVNKDDKNGRVMVQNTSASVKTYAVKTMADFKAKVIESHFDGMQIQIGNQELWIRLIGLFNVSNILAVYGAASLLDLPSDEILRIISTLGTVDGRFENVRSPEGVTAIIDYAHTPDALKNVLTTIREIKDENSELITVVGAGGDRDRRKRPVMGRLSAELSEKVILTSDNPRSEDPILIIEEMFEGIDQDDHSKVLSISDRKEAIRTACMMAKPGDVVLVAGKGHETYQEIKGVRSYFNDKQVVSELFDNTKQK